MNVSVAIQSHPGRAHLAEALHRCFQGRAEIVWDPDTNTHISPWRTYRHALEQTPAEATHRLIVQDDVIICDGFMEAADAAIAAQPDRVVCFFVAGQPLNHATLIRDAVAERRPWAELGNRTWIPTVATCWPVRHIVPMLAWFDAQNFPPAFTADDEICGRWLQHLKEPMLATVPSLVEHPDTEPSLVRARPTGGIDPARRAAVWIEDLGFCDARQIDWTVEPRTVQSAFTA